ncbi:MAG: cell division protein FtsX [Alphaproteobacteria bacterium HGW-Alphaproteobacteria-2]|nr:MAG: cell division protein FtsX [Alphaproteobacteria bacterium HGW-Alphaproteobacteria-2]
MRLPSLFRTERSPGSVVPPSGFTARLLVLTAAAMAFLAVFSLALALAAGRMAERWSQALSQTATVRIMAHQGEEAAATRAVLAILETTPGIAAARALTLKEQRALLEPWLGPGLAVESLPLPQLVEVTEAASGFDAEGLRLRLAAEVPGAVLDDHTRWRRPLAAAAGRLRAFGLLAVALITVALAALVTLAAQSALAANAQVIEVLRLVGARDVTIARAFTRRFTLRTLAGAGAGTALGMLGVWMVRTRAGEEVVLTGLGFEGAQWALALLIPPMAGVVAFWATRTAALASLRRIT